MGVFSRFLDIVNANINSLLDKAEDPEKMIKLMMQEMEDTLIELKSSAPQRWPAVPRASGPTRNPRLPWSAACAPSLPSGREDLAREALLERRRRAPHSTN